MIKNTRIILFLGFAVTAMLLGLFVHLRPPDKSAASILLTEKESSAPIKIPILDVVQHVQYPSVNAASLPSAFDISFLISRLRDWQAETNPNVQFQIEQELETMLSDTNAEEIVRALPCDLLTTPFAEISLKRWATLNRRAAADWMAGQTEPSESLQSAVIYGWLQQDKQSLNDYLNTLPAGEWKQSALKLAASDALANEHPVEAVDHLSQMDKSPQRDEMLMWGITAWARTDPEAALQWINSFQDAESRQKSLGAMAVGLAWQSPETAAKLLIDNVKPGQELDQSVESVVSIWLQTDPKAAAEWVAQFPAGDLQSTTLEAVITKWAYEDFAAAQNWVEELPASDVRDSAIALLANANASLHQTL